jgi:hypothetical protein
MRTRGIIGLILAFGLLTTFASPAQGADTPETQEGAIGRTPPRLSATWGDVSYWRPGAQDWAQAQANTPLAPGDLLYTGAQGNLEIQIGSRAFVRVGPNSQLGFENQEPDFLQFKVTAGNASFDLRTVEPGRTVEVNTPNAVFTIEHEGYYRVDVTDPSTSFISRRGGQATASYPGGEPAAIEPSEDVVIEGTERPQLASYAAPQLDEWDKWNYARTDQLLDAVSARYVSPGVYGVDDLDVYGTWRIVPTYGAVWVPRGVASGWVPYSTGSWVHDPYYGWSWVDTAPWGWAPYHYGRWVYVNGFWAWTPGPVVVRPAYAPALVAFFGGPSAGVGVSVGIGSAVGWVALGWGEPCVPWWGATSFRHRPWWGGWGGPRVVDNVVVRNTTVVNVQEINVYSNVGVRNAVVVVKEDHFGRGPITSARLTKVDVKNFRPIHEAPPVTPTPASFVPREKRGVRPPEKILERSVVATRPSQARTESATGKVREAGPERVPAPHIVSPPQHRETSPVLHRPPYGQRGVERSTERARPAEPPKMKAALPSEPARKGTTQVSPKAPTPQREPQQAAPSRVGPQPSGGRTEPGRAQPAGSPSMEGQRERPEQPPKGPTSVTPQAAPASSQQPRGSHVAGPAPAESRPSARGGESARQPSGTLPGEPANRISPNRSERKQQPSIERGQEPERSGPPRGGREDAPRGRPGD